MPLSKNHRLTPFQTYYVEILFKEAWGSDHVSLWWTRPGESDPEIIASEYLHSYIQPTDDLDGDALPDALETANGLDPLNGIGGGYLDSDGDGLSDHEEINQFGTDPLDSDSDNDGVSDGIEINELYTNPLVAEFNGTVDVVATLTGSQTNLVAGDWEVQGTELLSKSRRGFVEYEINFPARELYCLKINATHHWNESSLPIDTSHLQIYIDGLYVGNLPFVSADDVNVDVRTFLPIMPAGNHTIRIFWENDHSGLAFQINTLELQNLGGPDANGNGIKDWVEIVINQTGSIDPVPVESYISPLYIEGNARYVRLMDGAGILYSTAWITGMDNWWFGGIPMFDTLAALKVSQNDTFGTTNQNIVLHPSAGKRWYANLPLNEEDSTTALLSFQNETLVRRLDTEWVSYSAMEHDGETLQIRQGDSLRIKGSAGTSWFPARFTLTLDGTQLCSNQTDPYVLQFNTLGIHTVVVQEAGMFGSSTGTIIFEVIDGLDPLNGTSGGYLDTDGDGLSDYDEIIQWGTNSRLTDTDGDGLSDQEEINEFGTDPLNADTDGDTISDSDEIAQGSSPTLPVWQEGGLEGLLQVEQWNGIDGGKISDLIASARFGVDPDNIFWISTSESLQDVGANYGLRIRGTITAPTDGDYTFNLTGDDTAQVWLSTNDSPYQRKQIMDLAEYTGYRELSNPKSVASAPVVLVSNQTYYVEILMKEATGEDHVTLWWTRPGESDPEIIASEYLHSYVQPVDDQDMDGLPDAWEIANGLNPLDGTGGGYFDSDGDFYSDFSEYRLGFSPAMEGVDLTEEVLVGNGEIVPPLGAVATTVAALNGSSVSGSLGTWVVDGQAIYAVSRRGQVEYKANLQEGDIYRFEIGIKQQNIVEAGKKESYRLRFAVDGEFVERQMIELQDDELATVSIQTPFLNAGEHVVQVFWDNFENEISLRIKNATFQQYSGEDSNSNGIKDWVENQLIQRNIIGSIELASRTSPVCMEGRGRYVDSIQLQGSDLAFHGPDQTWFGNLSLNPDGLPHSYPVSFENGGRTLSRTLQWVPTNLLIDSIDGPIRSGDALLLCALPENVSSNGSFQVFVDGEEVLFSTVPQPYIFSSNGVHSVRGVYSEGGSVQERTIQVNVVGVESETIAAMVDKARSWSRPEEWPEDAILQLDSRIMQSMDTAGNLILRTPIEEELYGVVRLGQNGPVLASVVVKGFNMWFTKHTYLHYVEIHEDGSFTSESTMIMSPNIPEVWANQRCRFAISYEDGSRIRDFYHQDYNQLGEVKIIFAHSSNSSASVCHYTDIYQDDVLIGRTY